MMKRGRLPPKPPEPPSGYMYWYWELLPIVEVQRRVRLRMGAFDRQPKAERDKLNYGTGPRGRNFKT
jgi:hypothetical protein